MRNLNREGVENSSYKLNTFACVFLITFSAANSSTLLHPDKFSAKQCIRADSKFSCLNRFALDAPRFGVAFTAVVPQFPNRQYQTLQPFPNRLSNAMLCHKPGSSDFIRTWTVMRVRHPHNSAMPAVLFAASLLRNYVKTKEVPLV